MKNVVIELIISTPVQMDADMESTAFNLLSGAKVARTRADALQRLSERGWIHHPPYIREDGDYSDVIVTMRKKVADDVDPDRLIDEARICGATGDLNFNFGWNDKYDVGSTTDVEWWTDL